jgi:RHS repeat-associated protein
MSNQLTDKEKGDINGDGGDQYTGLDRFGRVVDQRWLKTSTGTATDRFKYGYDRNSNALYRTNEVNHNFDELYHASGAGNGYDNLNQLSGFLRGVLTASGGTGTPLDTVASPSTTESWAPDALGNFTSVTLNGTQTNRTHNQQNEVTGVGAATLTFDKNGNMTTDETGHTYIYDAWNRLISVKNGGTTLASYSYDGLGRRISENHGGTVNDLYYSAAWQVLEERTGGVSTATIQNVWSPVYIDALILRDRSTLNNGTLDERLWVQQDANWNVTALLDNNGNVVERYAYDPYGLPSVYDANWNSRSASSYSFVIGFQGTRLDTATGNNNFRGREYRPPLGRPVQLDPLELGPDNNAYRWEQGDPSSYLDPYGLQYSHSIHTCPAIIPPDKNAGRLPKDVEAEIKKLEFKPDPRSLIDNAAQNAQLHSLLRDYYLRLFSQVSG